MSVFDKIKRCAVPGCPDRAAKRGWCGKHYQRWRAHGDPLVTRHRPHVSPTIVSRRVV